MAALRLVTFHTGRRIMDGDTGNVPSLRLCLGREGKATARGAAANAGLPRLRPGAHSFLALSNIYPVAE